ncbi:MAG: hypothetical protein M3P39_01245, partial [Actinomycetota bacterium]|nr:hypothetical protein [Actinomycetota bacterium]
MSFPMRRAYPGPFWATRQGDRCLSPSPSLPAGSSCWAPRSSLLLLVGFPLPFVVTANLALALVTRVPVAIRLGRDLAPGRLAGLVGGSVPGLWLGAVVLTAVAEATIRAAAGLVT